MKTDVYYHILENGLDFLLHSLRPPIDLDEDAESDVLPKFLVLNLAAATELILKSRLCKEHWSLIFQNPDKASVDCLHSGEFCSATFDTCVVRLERICGVEFRGCDRHVLGELRARRNCYQHLRTLPNPNSGWDTVMPLCGKVLGFLLDFLDRRFESGDFTAGANEALSELRQRLSKFHELRENRLAQLKSQLQPLVSASQVERCLACGERTLELKPIVKCLFCNWSATAVEAARAQSEEEEARRKESLYQQSLFPLPPLPYVSIRQCERCGVEAMISRSSDDAGRSVKSSRCYACGASAGGSTA